MRKRVVTSVASWPWLSTIAIVAGLSAVVAQSVTASEALGELNLRLRAVEVVAPAGEGGQGTAIVEAVLASFPSVDDVRLTFFVSDGVRRTPATRRMDPGRLIWRREGGGEDPADVDGLLSLRPLDRLVTVFELDFEQRGVYEFVVKASGVTASGPVRAEAMVLLPVGADLPQPAKAHGAVQYRASASKEVR